MGCARSTNVLARITQHGSQPPLSLPLCYSLLTAPRHPITPGHSPPLRVTPVARSSSTHLMDVGHLDVPDALARDRIGRQGALGLFVAVVALVGAHRVMHELVQAALVEDIRLGLEGLRLIEEDRVLGRSGQVDGCLLRAWLGHIARLARSAPVLAAILLAPVRCGWRKCGVRGEEVSRLGAHKLFLGGVLAVIVQLATKPTRVRRGAVATSIDGRELSVRARRAIGQHLHSALDAPLHLPGRVAHLGHEDGGAEEWTVCAVWCAASRATKIPSFRPFRGS